MANNSQESKNSQESSSKAYQNSASFVPKLATKVLKWLDVRRGDVILDVGCGDGVLAVQIALQIVVGVGGGGGGERGLVGDEGVDGVGGVRRMGRVHGIDASRDMIAAAREAARAAGLEGNVCGFDVLDASQLSTLPPATYTKIFSNAAMHWILGSASTRASFFADVKRLLKPGGVFVFEMGGRGNIAEMRTALLGVVGRRVGMQRVREVDPWFFPDEGWVRGVFGEEDSGSGSGCENEIEKEGEFEGKGRWQIEQLESEYRATPVDKGGIEGWVKLMGKQFFDVLGEGEERREAEREVCDVLETVCRSSGGGGGGGDWIGYVRLRGVVRRV
ncbi:hypothetical protein DSL72_006301 [Monilinia vaccinii-corymbosi]|uniref:Methyltransferase domain-containing protein n=1 Tax=Monilinia vaccinii-corymbosi TaxID=61207 RepID=A0A8A3PND0_9HELO|nr:hypothetical protein DSL72_006301 [Monilinia vaccinii-corymbosi]